MKGWIIGLALLIVIVWQWDRINFFLFEYPLINTDGVKINGKPWRDYVSSTSFTVRDFDGTTRKTSMLVEKEIERLLKNPWDLYNLKKEGRQKHETSDISALVVLEAIALASKETNYIDTPFFG